MKPYYDDGQATIYHGDCRDVVPELPDFDLLLTDPPYGIASIWKRGSANHGWTKANEQTAQRNEWDAAPPSAEDFELLLSKAKSAVVWGGNYFGLPASRCWLVWNKPERGFSLAEAELAWTNTDAVVRVFDCNRSEQHREHPTQKPLALMRWCLGFYPKARTVLDPFMGSGTTLRAAKDAGCKAVGIELDERWCDLAARRLAQESLFGDPA